MIKTKNSWKSRGKSSKKVMCKLRIGLVTVFDLYFTIGVPEVTVTFMNFSLQYKK